MVTKEKPRFSLNYNEDYREFMAMGAMGGMNPNKCTIVFYDDKPMLSIDDGVADKIKISEINRELQASVYLTPIQFKLMAQWMGRMIQVYEKRFGEIKLVKIDDTTRPSFIS